MTEETAEEGARLGIALLMTGDADEIHQLASTATHDELRVAVVVCALSAHAIVKLCGSNLEAAAALVCDRVDFT